MGRTYDLDDDSVVVVIGSGAGGGTLSNELAQQGIDVVCLEAGRRLSVADFRNDEAYMFRKLTWLDPRQGSGELNEHFPAYLCKTAGGTTAPEPSLDARRRPRGSLQAAGRYGFWSQSGSSLGFRGGSLASSPLPGRPRTS